MVLHVSEISEVEEKHPLIEELGKLVSKDHNPGIDGILEVTYGYKKLDNGKRYNTSLFQEYCGIPYVSENTDFGMIKDVFISNAGGDIEKFKELSDKIENSDDAELSKYGIGKSEKRVLLKTIEDNICLLELAINGIDFELEKAGYDHGLSDDQVKEKIKENERLETIVFGGNILENKKESEYAYLYLQKGFQKYKKMSKIEKKKRVDEGLASRVLDETEEGRLSGYIDRVQGKIIEKGYSTEAAEKKETKNLTRDFFDKFSHVNIPRDTFQKFFQGSLDLQGMRQTADVTGKTAVYDGPNSLEIPDSEDFENLNMERVCGLLVHEISAHYVNQANHEAGAFGNVRLSGNVEKEEGLAMLTEKMFKGLPVSGEDVVNPSFVMVMAAEIFSGDELEDFIDLYMDISERKSDPKANMNRRKRNYPDDYVGVQHKDVTYVRGLIRVADYLSHEEGEVPEGHIEDLFVGKVGIDSILAGDFRFDQEKMLFPILNAEIMLFYIMNALDGKKINEVGHDDFVEYIREKYKGIVSEKSLQKLKETKLGAGSFRGVLRTIAPIIKEFTNQYAANDDENIPHVLSEVSQQVSNLIKKAA